MLRKKLIEPVISVVRWRPCACLKFCFRTGMTRKKLELFEMHTCLWPGAQYWLRHKWRKMVTASTSFHCIDGYRFFRCWNEVFYAEFQVSNWNFLVFHFDGSVCNWIPKVIWPWMDWFWVFWSKMASFVELIYLRTEIWKKCSIVFFWRFRFFSMFTSRDILVWSLKTLVPFNQMIL